MIMSATKGSGCQVEGQGFKRCDGGADAWVLRGSDTTHKREEAKKFLPTPERYGGDDDNNYCTIKKIMETQNSVNQ